MSCLKAINPSKVVVYLVLISILNSSYVKGQNSDFTSDEIKIYPGMILEYETKLLFDYFEKDEVVTDDDYLTKNETITILEIDYFTGDILVDYQWESDEAPTSMIYNTTIDRFGNFAIFTDWSYWRGNVSDSIERQSNQLYPDIDATTKIIDNKNNFGYIITQSDETETFGRITKFNFEKNILYSKLFGVLTEDSILRSEEGPNGLIKLHQRTFILTTDLDEISKLVFRGLFWPIFFVFSLIIVVYLYNKFRSKGRS
ncbi:MAG: hypothetical protein GPJ54_09415 [Candidatus Heimdallarchaeota archaeon]|nr:hypothetical protein [Candidatus Heimdallarchaeota archaeon]